MSEQDAPNPAGATKARRPLWMVTVALLLASAALWGSSRLIWFAGYRDAGVRGVVLDQVKGADRAGALVPLAILALAGIAGLIATGGWPRRVLGAIVALAGLAAIWTGVDGAKLSGFADGLPVFQLLAGRGLAVAGGILLVFGGLSAIKGAGRMPKLGARYSAPGAKRAARDPDTELWEALSEGEDPTAAR